MGNLCNDRFRSLKSRSRVTLFIGRGIPQVTLYPHGVSYLPVSIVCPDETSFWVSSLHPSSGMERCTVCRWMPPCGFASAIGWKLVFLRVLAHLSWQLQLPADFRYSTACSTAFTIQGITCTRRMTFRKGRVLTRSPGQVHVVKAISAVSSWLLPGISFLFFLVYYECRCTVSNIISIQSSCQCLLSALSPMLSIWCRTWWNSLDVCTSTRGATRQRYI